MSAQSRRAGAPQKLWNRFHTQTPRLQISHFSPLTKTYFFLQRQHPANCILPPPFPAENEFGKFKGTVYVLFFPWLWFVLIFLKGADARRSWGIGVPQKRHLTLVLFPHQSSVWFPVEEAHVNTFHSKPHLILPHAQRGSLALTVQKLA